MNSVEKIAHERILALDAITTAAEGIGNYAPGIAIAVELLRDELDKYFSKQLEKRFENFGDFLAAQKMAVKNLLKNPSLFGG